MIAKCLDQQIAWNAYYLTDDLSPTIALAIAMSQEETPQLFLREVEEDRRGPYGNGSQSLQSPNARAAESRQRSERLLLNQKNRQVIEEFRANGGVVTVTLPRGPILILHSRGARTGQACVTPLMYLQDHDRYIVFGSMGGARRNPDWYYNLVANPEAKIEVGTEAFAVMAAVIEDDERDSLFARQANAFPQFAYYQRKTRRRIPVISLERAARITGAGS